MSAGISDRTSAKISFLAFVFAVAVAFAHCAWTAESEIGRSLLYAFKILVRVTVPFFFLVSGFFLARHIDEPGWWRREVGKRVKSLMVPYVVWTLVLALVLWVETRHVMGPGGLGLNLFRMPALGPLWYLRCLMLFVVTLPLWKLYLKKFGLGGIVFVYAVALAAFAMGVVFKWPDEVGIGSFIRHGYSLEGLVYFLLGVYIQKRGGLTLSRAKAAGAAVLGAVLVVLAVLSSNCSISPGLAVTLVTTPFALTGIWGLSNPPPLPTWLSGCAYPVYLMHGIVLNALRNWGGTYRTCNPYLEFALCIIVPVVCHNLVRRYVPKASAFLFGGR